MSGQIATRMTCFAVLAAIETDLRATIDGVARSRGIKDFLPDDVRRSAAPRRALDQGDSPVSDSSGDADLMDYLDFADLAKALTRLKGDLVGGDIENVAWIAARLVELAPTRNRVCHSRPLEVEDLPTLLDFGRDLTKKFPRAAWTALRSVFERLDREPTFVLYTTIPSYWAAGATGIQHNLPLPEFDDTGFVGRKDDRKLLEKYLRSANPVITIVGEGGAGKTALAQRCLYDLVERADSPFEVIVWVSLKSRILTSNGVQAIQTAVASTIGMVDAIQSELGGGSVAEPLSAKFAAILEFMSLFRTVLAIDNLESLPAQELRELYSAVPAGSKILITSRVGLGEVELRYALGPLSPTDSSTLFRSYARFLNKPTLARIDPSRFCERLHQNPLLIKWFVSSVVDGRDPNGLLASQSQGLDQAIRFCFENLYATLSDSQRAVIEVLSCAGRPVAEPELRYLLRDQVEGDDLQWALNLLHRSSILRTDVEPLGPSGGAIYRYALSDIASQYVARVAKPSNAVYNEVMLRLRELRWAEQEELVRRAAYKYDSFAVHSINKYDRIASGDLRNALRELREGRHDAALALVARARELARHYSEVDRVAAMIFQESGELYAADEHYRSALEINPNSGVTLYTYSTFLLRSDRYEEGLEVIQAALRLDANDLTLRTRLALYFTRLGRFGEAAQIYEDVLASVPPYQKWRQATLREAAENYRRWAESFVAQQDFQAGRERLRLAFGVLARFHPQERWDVKCKRVAWKVASDMLFSLSGLDQEWNAEAIPWLTNIMAWFGQPDEEIRGLQSAVRVLGNNVEAVRQLRSALAPGGNGSWHALQQRR